MLTPSRHCDSRAFHARQSRRILESGSLAPPPAALRRFPTFSFVLAKDKVNCPEGKRGAPGGKRAAPGTKKKSAGSGFRDESCSFFLCVYVLIVGSLVLCGLVSPLAPLPLTGARRVRFLLFGTGSICFQILQQHELNIICNRSVLFCRQFSDFIQHIL